MPIMFRTEHHHTLVNAYHGCFEFNWIAGIPATQLRQLVQDLVPIQMYVKGWPSVLVIQQRLNLMAPAGHSRSKLCLNLCCCCRLLNKPQLVNCMAQALRASTLGVDLAICI